MKYKKLKNYINGEWVESKTNEYRDVTNPATGEVIARNPRSTKAEVEEAVRCAEEAFPDWRDTPVPDRVQPLFKFASYLKENQKDLAVQIVNEHGKTFKEAAGEIMRSWQYVEHACAAPDLMKGEITVDVAQDVSEYFIRVPLGVFAFIGPFNFPALTSLYWVWAVACGNTAVVKAPSKTPCTINKIFEEGVDRAGFPDGVVNLVNCDGSTFSHVLELDGVEGITFIGSTKVARRIYKLAAEKGKRAQCMAGANNCAVVMPDANFTSDAIMGNILRSCFGNTGQRCFALSNIFPMAEIYEPFKEKFVEAAKNLKLGYGLDEGTDVGPVVTKENLEMLHREIERGVEEGAKLLLDGRDVEVEGYPNGNWLGPTIFENVEPGMHIFEEEIFGPVVCLKKVESLDEAIELINSGKYGHSAVIYTEMGEWSQRFIKGVNVGQVGVNLGTPAPIGFYPLGGRRQSKFGALRARGRQAIDFYTDQKVVITRWLGSREAFERTWMENI
jgi:malonate-semialdehyde dehydrogenase (acetylating)/methylmalonate-semialdehyde dehydrogenase